MANKSSKIVGTYDWEVEDALRTLMRAKEIEKDAKLMEKVQKLAKEKMMAHAAVATDTDD